MSNSTMNQLMEILKAGCSVLTLTVRVRGGLFEEIVADGHYDYVSQAIHDLNYPGNWEADERELILVCFRRVIDDNVDPAKSELLQELDKLGLQPAGLTELCEVGASFPTLQKFFPIVARRDFHQTFEGGYACPVLTFEDGERWLAETPLSGWSDYHFFLASRK